MREREELLGERVLANEFPVRMQPPVPANSRSPSDVKALSIGSMGSTGEASTATSAISWHGSGSGRPSSTTHVSPFTMSERTVMLFIVRVPVLSTQMTVAEPRVSMTGERRVSTLRLDMRHAPSARNTVRTMGNSSGSSAIAAAMPASRPSSHNPRVSP